MKLNQIKVIKTYGTTDPAPYYDITIYDLKGNIKGKLRFDPTDEHLELLAH